MKEIHIMNYKYVPNNVANCSHLVKHQHQKRIVCWMTPWLIKCVCLSVCLSVLLSCVCVGILHRWTDMAFDSLSLKAEERQGSTEEKLKQLRNELEECKQELERVSLTHSTSSSSTLLLMLASWTHATFQLI